MENKRPSVADGKICYIEIPAIDITASADFYQKVFDWNIRNDGDENISFDDTIGEVSGMWVGGREPSTNPGILISIMVLNIHATIEKIISNGGKIVQPVDDNVREKIALFNDPAGNVFCLYQSSRS